MSRWQLTFLWHQNKPLFFDQKQKWSMTYKLDRTEVLVVWYSLEQVEPDENIINLKHCLPDYNSDIQMGVLTWMMNRLHCSEKRGLCLMKWPGEMLQNLPHFIYSKTQSCFFNFSFHATLFFPLMNALVYVDIDQGIN